MNPTQLMTFGDSRRMILEVCQELKNGTMEPARGMAFAANMDVLNKNVQVEINAAKLAIQTEGKAHSFGRVVGMGRRMIGNSSEQDA